MRNELQSGSCVKYIYFVCFSSIICVRLYSTIAIACTKSKHTQPQKNAEKEINTESKSVADIQKRCLL